MILKSNKILTLVAGVDEEIVMEKNFCIVLRCVAGSHRYDDICEWTVEYGPYTNDEATKILAELKSSYSPMKKAAVREFSILKLEPKTVAEINVEIDRINAEARENFS